MVNSNYTNRCCILSGPNGAGKTVYVKQTSIIVFLAHIGSFVPAELACVPLVDQIVCSSSARSLYMDHYGLDQ
jgi:DNA mismatch repair protein MSH5